MTIPKKVERSEVFAAIYRERNYQDAKWGDLDEHPHQVGAWLTILRRELREAEDAWATYDGDKRALEEVLQVAAVAVACLTQHNQGDLIISTVAPIEPDYEVGSWITVLTQKLRVAESMWCVQFNQPEALITIAQLMAFAVLCIQQHGIYERYNTND
jgi:hypothetical protein